MHSPQSPGIHELAKKALADNDLQHQDHQAPDVPDAWEDDDSYNVYDDHDDDVDDEINNHAGDDTFAGELEEFAVADELHMQPSDTMTDHHDREEERVDNASAPDLAIAVHEAEETGEELPNPVLDERPEIEPVAKRRRRVAAIPHGAEGSGGGWTKKNKSPQDILGPLSPPGCVITLSFRDYRFKAIWKRHISCEYWIDELSNLSFSHVFTKDNWKNSLSLVHAHAWEKWSIAKGSVAELKLGPGQRAQNPGEISDAVFADLQPIVQGLDPPAKYGRSK